MLQLFDLPFKYINRNSNETLRKQTPQITRFTIINKYSIVFQILFV